MNVKVQLTTILLLCLALFAPVWPAADLLAVPASSATVPPSVTATPSTTELPPGTVMPVCTPPLCATDEVFYCPRVCPGGCGIVCATTTPTATSVAIVRLPLILKLGAGPILPTRTPRPTATASG